jgi:Bacterial Ig-like domain (group 3)/FG-GAP-like repeat/FG-GAP repeat
MTKVRRHGLVVAVAALLAIFLPIAPVALAQQSGAGQPVAVGRPSSEKSATGLSSLPSLRGQNASASVRGPDPPVASLRTTEPSSNSSSIIPVDFLSPVAYLTNGTGATEVAVADLNGDGIPDIVETDSCADFHPFQCISPSGGVAVLLGNGDGTFQPAATYEVDNGAISVVIADVNGDNKPDLVVGGGTSVSVLLGNGDGTFQSAVSYASAGWQFTPGQFVPISVADLNGDGQPDIVVANQCAASSSSCAVGSIGVLLNGGGGAFQPAVSYASGGAVPGSLVVTDLNSDGKPDLVVGNCATTYPGFCPGQITGQEETNGIVGILLGNGDGTFQPTSTFSSGSNVLWPPMIAVADLNGDGAPDLAVGGNMVGVFLGNGDGTFQGAQIYDTGGYAVAVADLNNDGQLDVVATGYQNEGSAIGVLMNNGNGTFQPPQEYPTAGSSGNCCLALADVNGDGIPDVEVASTLSVSAEVLLGAGDGSFLSAYTYTLGGQWPNGLVVTPLTGSGRPDLLVSDNVRNPAFGSANGAAALVLLNNGAPTVTALASSPNPSFRGEPATLTATLTGESGTPTGTVFFYRKKIVMGAATLSNGSATFSTSSLPVGKNLITAAYQGSSSYAPSTSAALTQVVKAPYLTETDLATSGSPSVVGRPVTFTASVSSADGAIPNGETVTFYADSTEIGTGTTNGGVATFTTSSLAAKTYTIKAVYSGDATFKESHGTVRQVVTKSETD